MNKENPNLEVWEDSDGSVPGIERVHVLWDDVLNPQAAEVVYLKS